MPSFYSYFKENMESMGLPAPVTLFGTLQAAVANTTVILSQIDKFGKAVTVGELIEAGTKLEGVGVIATRSTAFYVGAVIGSVAIATGRSLSCGASIADVILTANQYTLERPWLKDTLYEWPGIYSPKVLDRGMYHYQAMIA